MITHKTINKIVDSLSEVEATLQPLYEAKETSVNNEEEKDRPNERKLELYTLQRDCLESALINIQEAMAVLNDYEFSAE